MGLVIFLDSGPLGLATNPKPSDAGTRCWLWMSAMLRENVRLVVPEIVDYELRRKLLHGNKTNGLRQLDRLEALLDYAPLTTGIMRDAARLWAQARKNGTPTAAEDTLDVDVILAAQVLNMANIAKASGETHQAVLATTNVKHLAQFVDAKAWDTIRP